MNTCTITENNCLQAALAKTFLCRLLYTMLTFTNGWAADDDDLMYFYVRTRVWPWLFRKTHKRSDAK